MPHARNGEVELYYETFGDPAAEPLVLVRGLGSQLISWEPELVERFVAAGFFVVGFDNRDVGLSSHLDQVPPPRFDDIVARARAGDPIPPPYSLVDMADDALAVLDAVGVDRAHVLGISLGAAIAQRTAIHRGHRMRSLISVMGTTSDPDVGLPTPEARRHLLTRAPADRDGAIDHALRGLALYGSPGAYDDPDDLARERARQGRMWDRDHEPAGRARQLWAVGADGSRTDELRHVDVPTLVMHGSEDRLISPDGGQRTADAIPGARFVLIDGMGHDQPPQFWDRWVAEVSAHVGLGTPAEG